MILTLSILLVPFCFYLIISTKRITDDTGFHFRHDANILFRDIHLDTKAAHRTGAGKTKTFKWAILILFITLASCNKRFCQPQQGSKDWAILKMK